VDSTAMNDGIVAYGHIIAYACFRFFVSTMDYCAVLYIHFVSHNNGIDIASHHTVKPKTTVITRSDIANYGGIWGDFIVYAKRRKYIIYRKYESHILEFNLPKVNHIIGDIN
jgi:hypothetical protein